MGRIGVWVPADAPLDEGYWNALLDDPEQGGNGTAATRERLSVEEQWAEVYRAMEHGDEIELPVVASNRGGLVIGWNSLRGFVPASHLVNLTPRTDELQRQRELKTFVGRRLRLKVIEIDRARDRFVLSERACRRAESAAAELLEALCPGDICQGRVTRLCSFGAFVDLGGVEGLVHISELSWGRVDHPGDLLAVDQLVDVYVLDVDRAAKRIRLSVKRLQPDPWQSVERRYRVNQIVAGVITHVVDFGAFALLEDGLEGLIHVSEMADAFPLNPRTILAEGERVMVRILHIDSAQRRIGLSLRHANGQAESSG